MAKLTISEHILAINVQHIEVHNYSTIVNYMQNFSFIEKIEFRAIPTYEIYYVDIDVKELVCKTPNDYMKYLNGKFRSIEVIEFTEQYNLDFSNFESDIPINLRIISWTKINYLGKININSLTIGYNSDSELIKSLIPMVTNTIFAYKYDILGTVADEILKNNRIKKLYGSNIDIGLLSHPSLEFIYFKINFNSRYLKNLLIRKVSIVVEKDELNLYELVTNPNIIELSVIKSVENYYMESMKRKLYIRSNDPDAADIIQNNCNIELFDTNIDWVSQYYCGKSPFIILFLQIVENNKNKTLFKKTKVANQI